MIKKNKFIILFLVKALLLYVLWFVIYDLWIKEVGVLDRFIVNNLVYWAATILEGLGYMIHVDGALIGIYGGVTSVFVGTGCNGLEMIALFAGFVLIFEGSWKHKLWFIPLGIVILHFLNVLRVLALIFIGSDSVENLEFNHKYTFTIIMYLITFAGWMIWTKYFSKKKINNTDA